MTLEPTARPYGGLVDATDPPLGSTIATRITVGFHAPDEAIRARLPSPWASEPQTGDVADAPNLSVIFSDSLLNLDRLGGPAPDESTRSFIFLIRGTHPETGSVASFVFRIFTNHPEAVPGKYSNSLQAALKREQRTESIGLETRISELVDLIAPDGGHMELRLRYLRGAPDRIRQRSIVRSASDEGIVRVYESDELADILLDSARGIDRIQYYEFRSTVGEMSDLFDGSEKVVSIKVSPWYVRDVYTGVH